MANLHAVVLAAGQGTRMKSNLHKVLHPVCGKPMVQHVLDTLYELEIKDIVVVVGHQADQVRSEIGDQVSFALQSEQLGTGHAVQQAIPFLTGKTGATLILYGDVPLLSADSLKAMLEVHAKERAAATVLTAILDNPTGYGRVVRDKSGAIVRIVEQKDATLQEREIREINTGIYCFDNEMLLRVLPQLTNNNAQGEYYATDCIELLSQAGEKVAGYAIEDPEEANGVNDRVQLAQVEAILRKRINEKHMRNGVTIIDPANTYIDADVQIGPDTVIYPGTVVSGKTVIGSNCRIGPYAQLADVKVNDDVQITHSVLKESVIDTEAIIGPYAHIRPHSRIGRKAKIGDFVEVKNTTIASGSKVPHLSYIGDAEVGEGVNIGCGVVTVNYDGRQKHKTIIGDNAFVGCNANLIAPVTIGDNAYIAAGSTINQDVPEDTLAIARERQVNKPGYVKKILNRKKD